MFAQRLLVALLLVFVWSGGASAAEPARPNFILILLDDLGWRDVGFMGNRFVETPQLDRLAQRGLRFTQAYASAPNCSPTRACLLSGQYTPRHGVYTVVDPNQPTNSPRYKLLPAASKPELATQFVTLAEALRDGGYATGFFGMWNLGRGRTGPVTPGGQGFQQVVFPENLGFGKDAYFTDDGDYLSDRLTDELLKFVETHRERPFFAYLPDHAVHAPFEPQPELLKKYVAKQKEGRDEAGANPAYAATIEAVDLNVGRILKRLDELGLRENTYVIFTSDNGGSDRDSAPLRGGKGQLYEGGVRVPLVIAGPQVKAGAETAAPAASIDLYPTLLELAGLPPPAGVQLDGVSLAPLLRGGAGEKLSRERLFWHFPCYVGKGGPASAVREGDYKLIEFFEDGQTELYNLRDDPGEARNLATEQPARAAALRATLKAWQRETNAAIPSERNPAYDPAARGPRGKGGGMANGGQPGKAPAGKGPGGPGSQRKGPQGKGGSGGGNNPPAP